MKKFLEGKHFAFTGYFVFEGCHINRDNVLFRLIEANGGVAHDSVTDKVEVLVVGYPNPQTQGKNRTKLINAFQKDVELIAFWDFIERLTPAQRAFMRARRGKTCNLSDIDLLKVERIVNADLRGIFKQRKPKAA